MAMGSFELPGRFHSTSVKAERQTVNQTRQE
jgi:hypothetical protein